ncbi:MAG TPA: neutral/alkaline non-lysosomal ceramidase N-terminal domain-containing protein, partial [Terriglobales bacterium]|nr:neutral/alkaline non-lysosomal ceramidase N-terminal domain-containing protein [Terriglobales bacterium]
MTFPKLTLALALISLLAACDDDSRGSRSAPVESLQVGYSEVEVPWRVGAKPGQVGTNALPARDQLLLRALGQLLPILNPPVDPVAHITGATDWTLDMLATQVEQTMAGKYARLYEPGIGLEEPPVMKAVVLQRGDTKIAIVRADLYIGHEQLHRRVADLVQAETGLDRDHIFLVATHNHSVPHSVSPAPGVWVLADAFDPRHFVYVSRAIARAVVEADQSLRPAVLRTSLQEFREVQHNIIGPGVAAVPNPDGVSENVPVGYPRDHFDPDLAALRFDDAETGAPLAFLFVFGMHPESLPTGHGISSGEWPTHVENKLRQRTGAPSIWLPGALGDSEPDRGFNHPDHHFMRGSFDSMEAMSEIIADAAENAFVATATAAPQEEPRLAQVVADIAGVDGFPIPTSAYLGPRFPMVRILHDATMVRLHVVRIGDAVLLGTPAEVTTDLSFNIKTRVDRQGGNVYQGYEWPEAPVWVKERVRSNFGSDEVEPEQGAAMPIVISHANGYMGYI